MAQQIQAKPEKAKVASATPASTGAVQSEVPAEKSKLWLWIIIALIAVGAIVAIYFLI